MSNIAKTLFQWVIYLPLFFKTSFTLFGIDSTSRLQFSLIFGSRYHTCIIASISLVMVVQSSFVNDILQLTINFLFD